MVGAAVSGQTKKAGAFLGAGRKLGRKHRAPKGRTSSPVFGVKPTCRALGKQGRR